MALRPSSAQLKTKDISRASVQIVLALANVLGCQAEDLLEYSAEEHNKVPMLRPQNCLLNISTSDEHDSLSILRKEQILV